MISNLLLVIGIVVMLSSALYLRYERRKMTELLEEDDLNIYIYLAPESSDAYTLDITSDEVLARKESAQWN